MRDHLWMPIAALGLVAVLTACGPMPAPTPSSTATTAFPSGAATPSPTPTLNPEGSAQDNLALFTQVVHTVAAGENAAAGRAYVDALVAAGFPKEAMQVTSDTTSVGHAVDSLQFSVLWSGECLVGQVGPSTPEPTAMVLPELPEGGCLIGVTRTIDW